MSQMKPAECNITSIKIKLKKNDKINKYHFISKKEVITFLGYLKVNEFQKSIVDQEEEGSDEEEPYK